MESRELGGLLHDVSYVSNSHRIIILTYVIVAYNLLISRHGARVE